MKVLILVFLITLSIQQTLSVLLYQPGSCQPPSGGWWKNSFDLDKLSGLWYFMLRIDQDDNLSHRCALITANPLNNYKGFVAREFGLAGTSSSSYSEYLDVYIEVTTDTEPGTWASNKASVSTTYLSKDWILDIDYDSFVVIYKCSDDPSSGTYLSNIYVVSRGKSLCADTWTRIMTAITNSGVLSQVTQIPTFIPQTNCPALEI